jgi:hypothetical protein
MEHQEALPLFLNPEIHWFQLEPGVQICGPTKGKITSDTTTCRGVAAFRHIFLSMQSHQSPWKASTHLLHLPSHQTIPSLNLTFHAELHLPLSQTTCSGISLKQPFTDSLPSAPPSKQSFPEGPRYSQLELVGRCKHIIWHWHHHRQILHSVEICPRPPSGLQESFQHRLGRSRSGGTWFVPCSFKAPTYWCIQTILGSSQL